MSIKTITTEKNISFAFADRPDDLKRVSLAPGTTVREALQFAGLDPKKTHVFGPLGQLNQNEDLYRVVDDDQTLTVTQEFVAGRGV